LPPAHVREKPSGDLHWRLALVVRHALPLGATEDHSPVQIGPSPSRASDPLQALDRARPRSGVETDQDETRQVCPFLVAPASPVGVRSRPRLLPPQRRPKQRSGLRAGQIYLARRALLRQREG